METNSNTWTPTEKQSRFLESPHFEVLYGGAAGSGKTDALLVDACGLNQPTTPAICRPGYFAVMIRPTMPELREVIERTRSLYKNIDPGAEWYAGSSTWRFSSGARIAFTYLKEERDVDKFKSQEIHYLGWEELTLHPSSYGYLYLFTRVRKNENMGDLNLYIRSTTNPDGPGHEWVKRHWKIGDDGASTEFKVRTPVTDKKTGKKKTITTTRQFISATLKDNPYVDENYEANIRMSGAENTAALLEGRWDINRVEGAYYHKDCLNVISEGRMLDLPIDTHKICYTAWDLGASDYTSIWVMQKNGPWLDMVYFYQNHGEGISHYIKHLRDQGYNLGTFYLPHDAMQRKQGAQRVETIVDSFRSCGVYDIAVVKRVNSIMAGIDMTRRMFPSCRFDRERTRDGWKCLTNYRTERNARTMTFSPKPCHNEDSHGADAFRMFAQAGFGVKHMMEPSDVRRRAMPRRGRKKTPQTLRNNSVV